MGDITNRIAGTAYLTIDGVNYMLRGGFKYSVGLVSRESVAGMDGVHGYNEKPKAPSISAVLTDSGGLSVAELNAMTNVTAVCELANGKVITGRNMWTVDDQEVDSEEGKFDVKWEGLQGAVSEG